MRVGFSPTRVKLSDYRPARVTICVLTFIPEQIGYFAHRFNVLKLCLQSLVKHSNSSYDLLIFDNGSCPEVVNYLLSLRDQDVVQYLILSAQNIGIHNALTIMVNAAPGEIIAYSQDDVLFYPNWLQAQLEILDTFPRVGMVSGMPVREQFQYGNRYLQTYLSDNPDVRVKYGHFIPDDWERDFYVSTGREVDEEMKAAHRANQDILLEIRGIKAYSMAVHFQYIARKSVLLQGLTTSWDARLMVGPDKELDERIDSLGFARLSTYRRYVQHIGNVITPELNKSVSELGLVGKIKTWKPPTSFVEMVIQRRIIKGVLSRLNNWSYFLLNYRQLK
jgi:glycosyltransferase involved in cell wall biosynthesis